MDLRRFVALYVSETQEHLRLLSRSLLAMEQGAGSGAVDEAFRAAHTLKGLSAAMGYRAVADQAHHLEDTLERMRAGSLAADPEIIDELLTAADALQAAIEVAVETETPEIDGGESRQMSNGAQALVDSLAPSTHAATEMSVRVRLREDAPIKAARAMLVVRGLQMGWQVLRTEPAEFDDDFDGDFRVIMDPAADQGAIEAAILGAGDVESVIFESAAAPAAAKAEMKAAPVRSEAARVRHVRVDQRRIDQIADGIGEMSVLQTRLEREVGERSVAGEMVDRLSTLLSDLQHAVLSVRMVPIGEAFERFPRVVRDAARRLGKQIDFRIEGEGIEIDRSILDDIVDPLIHLLRNAVDHGIESVEEREIAGKPPRGMLVLRAERERSSVKLMLQDDGRGVRRESVLAKARAAGLVDASGPAELDDDDLLHLMAHPGLSTAEEVTELSGRGVGLDVVVARIRSLGGAIDMTTKTGAGTTFTLRLPITLALARALRVRVAGEDYAVPLTHVTEAVELDGGVETGLDGSEGVRLRDELLPLVRMSTVLDVAQVGGAAGAERAAVVAELGQRRTALAVDEIVGHEQILVKQFDAAVGTLPIFSGATLLADGRPALVLDPLSVI